MKKNTNGHKTPPSKEQREEHLSRLREKYVGSVTREVRRRRFVRFCSWVVIALLIVVVVAALWTRFASDFGF